MYGTTRCPAWFGVSFVYARLALEHAPAVVLETRAPARREVELLPRVLADVADVEVARRAVEREPPRVAQPVAHDHRRRVRFFDVEAQQLAERRAQILGTVLRVAAGAAVARPA